MADSVRASEQGLNIILQAAKKQGWTRQSPQWISKAYTSLATLKRFWARKAIEKQSFISICQAVGIEEYKTIVEPHQDLSQAPDLNFFCGRLEELSTLKTWIVDEQCRLIGIFGMGGIGKTSLTVKLVHEIKDDFEYVIWLSLREAPSGSELLIEILKFLSENQTSGIPDSLLSLRKHVIEYMTGSRCLIIFDNAESILCADTTSSSYRPDSRSYGDLIQAIGQQAHQSCCIITSRQVLPEFLAFNGISPKVKFLSIKGLKTEATSILEEKKVSGSATEYQQVIELYQGNPKALEIVSAHIQDLHAGDLGRYLADLSAENETLLFQDIRDLLRQQLSRLSTIEKQTMYWLAINREPISITDLRNDLLLSSYGSRLSEIIVSLVRQSLVEISSDSSRYTLQNVVMEHTTEEFIQKVTYEILTGEISLLQTHAVMKAEAKDYIREAQVRIIVESIIRNLVHELGSHKHVKAKISHVLDTWRLNSRMRRGYVAGNLLNLLVYLGANLTGYDLSDLHIRQAYLRDVSLRNTDFSNSVFEQSVFSERFSGILSLALSPNGEILATGDTDGHVRLWDVSRGIPLKTLNGHGHWIRSMAFSPDGTKLLSGSSDHTARIWDVTDPSTAKWLNILEGHQGTIWSVSFNHDGSQVVTGSDDKTARIWDAYNALSLRIFEPHSFWVRFVAVNVQDGLLVSGCADQWVSLWNFSNGDLCLRWQISGHQVRAASLSPDGKLLATGSDDNKVRLWNVHTGEIQHIFHGHSYRIWSIAFCPSGTHLASGGSDGTIRLWDIESGECMNTFTTEKGRLRSLAFSGDGRILAAGGDDQGIMLWNVMNGKCIHSIRANTYRNWSICLDHLGSVLFSGSDDNSARSWSVDTGELLKVFNGHSGRIRSVAVNHSGDLLATGSNDRTIRIWDVAQRKCLRSLNGHKDWLWFVGFSADGTQLLSAADDQTIRLWDIKTGQCLTTISHKVCWSWSGAFDGRHLIFATADEDGCIRLWDLRNGECLSTFSGHTKSVRSVAFSTDGNLLVSGSDDQTLRIWRVLTGDCIHNLSGPNSLIRSVSFNADGRLVACGDDGGEIMVWESSSGRLFQSFRAHEQPIWSIAFGADGDTLATASEDETIRIWDIKTGKPINILQPEKLYQGMNISNSSGLTVAQKELLLLLGAKD
jgi:WD40 repeat protein